MIERHREELRREVMRWCQYAKEDCSMATILLEREDVVPRHPAWLAQQSAEKALKALLIATQISAPRTHDLRRL
jgi:HEPN domain-containing protein